MHRWLVPTLAAGLLLAAPLAAQPAASEAPAAPAVVLDRATPPQPLEAPAGFERRAYRDGRVLITGQPSEAALAALAESGVTAIVNLRTQREMDDRAQVPYDERAAAERLGLDYVHLPIGGDETPWRVEVVDELARVLERHRGPVLLHCTVAWRASYVWTAYLVRHLGLPLDEALARGRAIGLGPDPLEKLLDRPVTYSLE